MNKLILVSFIIIFKLKLIKCQSIPSVPCPDIFNYVSNSQTGQIEGRITVLDTQPGRENLIYIKMSYPSFVRNKQPGTIFPTRNSRDIVRDIQHRQPVKYRVNFPTINPLPTVQEIMHNGRLICRNQYRQNGNSEIVLHFKLNVPNINSRVQSSKLNRIPENSIPERQILRNTQSSSLSGCGTSTKPARNIFAGEKLTTGSWPWLAAIFQRTTKTQHEYICGGSILTPNSVLTAAHCVVDKGRTQSPQQFLIGLGLYDVYKWNDPDTFIARAQNIIPHNDYGHTNRKYDADVAIILLDKSYSYNYRIRPVCMWSGSKDLSQIVSEQGHVAGWGVGKIGGGFEKIPNIVETEIVSTDRCRKSNSFLGELISNRNFCAGYRNGQGPCKGDSGSGLMIEKSGRWYLRGIVSGALGHVKRVCDLNEYVIYTDVAKFIRWIQAYVNF